MAISDWPAGERPREKFRQHGARTLSDTELLAILLRHGSRGRSACAVAHAVLTAVGGFAGLGATTVEALAALPGVGEVKAVTLAAACELARRWEQARRPADDGIHSSASLYERYRPQLRLRGEEHFLLIALDAKHRPVREHWVSQGDRLQTTICPRALFAAALASHPVAIALLHNHPSGDPQPSTADHEVTMQLAAAGHLLETPLLDHVIVGDEEYFSFRDAGLLPD